MKAKVAHPSSFIARKMGNLELQMWTALMENPQVGCTIARIHTWKAQMKPRDRALHKRHPQATRTTRLDNLTRRHDFDKTMR
jgi:hypothetical protein